MTNQVKVTETEIFKDAQSEHLVCRGRLVLIPIDQSKDPFGSGPPNYYIVSDTEKIGTEDNFLAGSIVYMRSQFLQMDGDRKILVMPENFSKKQILVIQDGKLKNGDVVLVECDMKCSNIMMGMPMRYSIKLKNNCIKMFKLENSKNEPGITNGDDIENIINNMWKSINAVKSDDTYYQTIVKDGQNAEKIIREAYAQVKSLTVQTKIL